MGYVCDGKIDCPWGFDEINCMNHSCIQLFHCFNTSQCIFVADVCDGFKDCMNGDDEFNCELQKSKCPKQCFCLGFAVPCNYSFQSVFSIGEVVQIEHMPLLLEINYYGILGAYKVVKQFNFLYYLSLNYLTFVTD